MALPTAEKRPSNKRTKVIKLGAYLGVIENVQEPLHSFAFGAQVRISDATNIVTIVEKLRAAVTPFALECIAPSVMHLHQIGMAREWKSLCNTDALTVNARLSEVRQNVIKQLKILDNVYPTSTTWSYLTCFSFKNADVFEIRLAPDNSAEIIVRPAGTNHRFYGYIYKLKPLQAFYAQLKSGTLIMHRILPATNKYYVEFTP